MKLHSGTHSTVYNMYLLNKTGFEHFVLSFLGIFSLLILRSNWDLISSFKKQNLKIMSVT